MQPASVLSLDQLEAIKSTLMRCTMDLQHMPCPGFAVKAVYILCKNIRHPAISLQAGQPLVRTVGRHIRKSLPPYKAASPVSPPICITLHELHTQVCLLLLGWESLEHPF
jgi:hypothetical protein